MTGPRILTHLRDMLRHRVRPRQRFSPLLAPKPTPEQVEKARAAMDAIHGDSGLLGRRL